MSKEYQITWPGHVNIYTNKGERDLTVYFSEPDNGVNEKTGLLLLIPGFGGQAGSNVYKKMRSTFADQYNLVTVQCDYFGQVFMQGSQSVQLNIHPDQVKGIFTDKEMQYVYNAGFDDDSFIKIGSRYPLKLTIKENLNETVDNFNDMGIMQALDHLAAIHYVMAILKDNNLSFDRNRVIIYGHSHGAYLGHLCNVMTPGLFTLLIDNSAWLFPGYLASSRYLTQQIGKMIIQVEFDYLAKKLEDDKEILSLPSLYEGFKNQCMILCYHGTADALVTHEEKKSFCERVRYCQYVEVDHNGVDGEIFKSTAHGLDTDYLKLFDHVMASVQFPVKENKQEKTVRLLTERYQYIIEYKTGVPFLKRKTNQKVPSS